MNQKTKNEELNRLTVDEFKMAEKRPIIIILDNIRSLINIGSVFRTADAFRIEKIYLCGITATPPHREINKSALGATESVDWEYCETTLIAINKCRSIGYAILSIEQAEKSETPESYHSNNKGVALIFGHEVDGVAQEVINNSDAVIEIKQEGTKHSLNISVSAGIVIYEFSKKFHKL
jgi:tRNA G18 (ribose-2'-O)-methylase SpoU